MITADARYNRYAYINEVSLAYHILHQRCLASISHSTYNRCPAMNSASGSPCCFQIVSVNASRTHWQDPLLHTALQLLELLRSAQEICWASCSKHSQAQPASQRYASCHCRYALLRGLSHDTCTRGRSEGRSCLPIVVHHMKRCQTNA